MAKLRDKAVRVLATDEVEAWQQRGAEPKCSEHRHITEREARLYVYPWQTINQTQSKPTAKVVGQQHGRVCIQMIAAHQWKTRSKSYLPAEAGMGIWR
jgi:hypothetical protein